MSSIRLLTAIYMLGVILFLIGLVVGLLNVLSMADQNAVILLLSGVVLMMGSKFAARAVPKDARQ